MTTINDPSFGLDSTKKNNEYSSEPSIDKQALKNRINILLSSKLHKYLSGAIILFVFILIGILITLFIFKDKVDKESKEESPGCPSYSCPLKDGNCGNSPYFFDPQQNNKKVCQTNYYYTN